MFLHRMVPDKLALLPPVKRQVFCVRDRLKMDKHKAWNNNYVVAPKLVGSMTTKGQMSDLGKLVCLLICCRIGKKDICRSSSFMSYHGKAPSAIFKWT